MPQLSLNDKYMIQGMLYSNKTLEEISSKIDKSEKIIKLYVDRELDGIYDTIAKIQLLKHTKIEDLIANDTNKNPFIQKTSGGTNVAISTPVTSQIGDAHHQQDKKTVGRSFRGTLWNIKEQKIDRPSKKDM